MKRLEELYAGDFLRDKYDITIHRAMVEDHRDRHFHDFIEIAYIAEGSGLHTVNDQEFRIARGDLFILGKGTVHEFQADRGKRLLVYNCIFQPEFIDGSLGRDDDFVQLIYRYLVQGTGEEAECWNSYLKLTGSPSQEIENIFEEMLQEYHDRKIGYIHLIRSDLIRLFIRVFRCQSGGKTAGSGASVLNRLIVQNTVEYMQEHCAGEISVGFLAEKFYLSPGYFSRIFKEITGETVISLLQSIRIRKACGLLETTAMPVTEVALDVGYRDMKYFYGLFRRLTGVTPRQYRREHLHRDEKRQKVQNTPIK